MTRSLLGSGARAGQMRLVSWRAAPLLGRPAITLSEAEGDDEANELAVGPDRRSGSSRDAERHRGRGRAAVPDGGTGGGGAMAGRRLGHLDAATRAGAAGGSAAPGR